MWCICAVYQLVHEILKFEVRPWLGIYDQYLYWSIPILYTYTYISWTNTYIWSITTQPGIGSPKAAGAFAPWQRWRDISVSLRRGAKSPLRWWSRGFPWGYPNSWMVYHGKSQNNMDGGTRCTPHFFLGNLQLTVWLSGRQDKNHSSRIQAGHLTSTLARCPTAPEVTFLGPAKVNARAVWRFSHRSKFKLIRICPPEHAVVLNICEANILNAKAKMC